jgi:hypothetical protein
MSTPHNLGFPARDYRLGTRKKGKDGKYYKVIETKMGNLRWQKVTPTLSGSNKKSSDLANIYDFRKLSTKQKIHKLDINNDNYVSVYEFLATKPSLGPKAKPGRIDFHYQNITNVISFFFTVIRRDPRLANKVACIPETPNPINRDLKASIFVFIRENKLFASPKLKRSIEKCKKDGYRFVIMTLNIGDIMGPTGLSHQNMLIADLKNKTIERFEPHGQIQKLFYPNDQAQVNRLIRNYLKKQKINYKYLPPKIVSPIIGPQSKADAFCGMCVTFSIMYTHLRLLNPHLSQRKVNEMMMRGTTKNVKDKIL